MLSTTASVICWILIAISLLVIAATATMVILNSLNIFIKKSPPSATDSTGAEKYFFPNKERFGETTFTDEEKVAALAEYREQMKKKQVQVENATKNFNEANKLI